MRFLLLVSALVGLAAFAGEKTRIMDDAAAAALYYALPKPDIMIDRVNYKRVSANGLIVCYRHDWMLGDHTFDCEVDSGN